MEGDGERSNATYSRKPLNVHGEVAEALDKQRVEVVPVRSEDHLGRSLLLRPRRGSKLEDMSSKRHMKIMSSRTSFGMGSVKMSLS
jgi:hypothetical protein